jgi:HEPN domain-containing protein
MWTTVAGGIRVDKIEYWLDLAKEDVNVAEVLYNGEKLLYAGFMCHLAVEKALKARIESIGETPTKIHNLIRLAELGAILDLMTEDQTELLDTLNPLQIEARYPAYKQQIESILPTEQCAVLIQQTREFLKWIEMLL